MNKKVIAREGLIFLATCLAFCVLATILPALFGIALWPVLTVMPFAPLVIPFYALTRWIQGKRRRCS